MSKKNSPKRIIGFLFDLWRISPIMTWSMIFAQVVFAVLTSTIAPMFVSQLLTSISEGSATINGNLWLLLGYAIVLFMGDVVAFRATMAMIYITEIKMQTTIAKKMFEHLSAKSLSYHSSRMSGGVVSDASKLDISIEFFWDTLVLTIVPIVTIILSVCIALGFMFWQFALILAILSVIVTVLIIKSQTKMIPISEKVAEKSSNMDAYFIDIIGNIAAVKAFAREKTELTRYQQHLDTWSKTMLAEMKGVVSITSSFGVMMTGMNIAAFAAAIFATQYKLASIGTIYLVVVYTISVVNELLEVSNATRSYLRIVGDASPMINTLSERIELRDPARPKTLKITKGKIEFDKITFFHKEYQNPLFNDFSLTIQPGEHVGIIGKSGSGKTSLVKLLLRFSDVNDGQILIDGHDVADVTQNDLRSAISYVSQEPMLFHRSLRENITYGKPNASEEEIEAVVKKSHATDFIKKLPKGLNTIVGERGSKLSGGQRQIIAIARAILKNSPILVLDEATSSLDIENEKLIQEAIVELMKGRTSIVIAHRLSTIAKLDRIIVMDNGKIIEQGSHNDLIQNNGIYADLWLHQSGDYIK